MNEYIIYIKNSEKIDTAKLVKDGSRIIFQYGDIHLEETNVFPFVALRALRTKLEKNNIVLLINGSRIDVFPTGMLLYSDYASRLIDGQPIQWFRQNMHF